jgi:hypothetical protein
VGGRYGGYCACTLDCIFCDWDSQEGLLHILVDDPSRLICGIQDDFEQFAWTIVFLAMGGIALGRGVTSSGLLEDMDVVIRDLIAGLSLYSVVLIISAITLVCHDSQFLAAGSQILCR